LTPTESDPCCSRRGPADATPVGTRVCGSRCFPYIVSQEIDVQYDYDGEQPPIARVTVAPQTATPGDEITLDATRSEAPSGSIVAYDWWIQDADRQRHDLTRDPEFSGPRKTVSIEDTTNLMVMLSVTDDDGSSDLVTQVIEVNGD